MFFRVEFLVAENKLGRALAALAGVAHRQPDVKPVINVIEAADGSLQQASNGSLADQFAAYVLRTMKPGDVINASHAKTFATSLGFQAASYSYMLRQLQERKVIKKKGGVGAKTGYTILKQPEAK